MKRINNLKTYTSNPNLTLVLPGPCNAHCSFCTWKREPDESGFLSALYKLMLHLPPNFRQISISGGEPTLSPALSSVLAAMEILKVQDKIDKVVLTTNGSNLHEVVSLFANSVDRVNLSRHHFMDEVNQNIFKCATPLYENVSRSLATLSRLGIDTNLNCVLNENRSEAFLTNYVEYAKRIGAYLVTFRNMYDDHSESQLLAHLREYYKATSVSSCPVCRTEEYLYNGMKIRCHISDEEPTTNVELQQEIYELILHPDGTLSEDWAKQKPVRIGPITKQPSSIVPAHLSRYLVEESSTYNRSCSSSGC